MNIGDNMIFNRHNIISDILLVDHLVFASASFVFISQSISNSKNLLSTIKSVDNSIEQAKNASIFSIVTGSYFLTKGFLIKSNTNANLVQIWRLICVALIIAGACQLIAVNTVNANSENGEDYASVAGLARIMFVSTGLLMILCILCLFEFAKNLHKRYRQRFPQHWQALRQ